MSEFDAYDKLEKKWKTFPISKYSKVRQQKDRYGPVVVCHETL